MSKFTKPLMHFSQTKKGEKIKVVHFINHQCTKFRSWFVHNGWGNQHASPVSNGHNFTVLKLLDWIWTYKWPKKYRKKTIAPSKFIQSIFHTYGKAQGFSYHIYPAVSVRRGFFDPLKWLQITKSVLWNVAIIQILPFLNNSKDLDPSYKMDLDLWVCFGRTKLCLITEEIWYVLYCIIFYCILYCMYVIAIDCIVFLTFSLNVHYGWADGSIFQKWF